MNYSSKPLSLDSINAESFEIRQNVLSTIVTSIVVSLAAIFFIFKFIMEQEHPIILYIIAPFLLISIYYSTIGRKSVTQVVKKWDHEKEYP